MSETIEERTTSPDGALTMVVKIVDDDVSVRFEGHPWHVHGDELCDAGYSDTSDPIAAARAFAAQVVDDRIMLVLQRVDGAIHDVWVTDDLERELTYDVEGELEFRHWTRAD